MNTSSNHYDAIEQLIFEDNIRIESVAFDTTQDVMDIRLNTKAILQLPLSSFPTLKNGSEKDLHQYQLIANGTGIHWPTLDEDLSLKGFLQQELKRKVNLAA